MNRLLRFFLRRVQSILPLLILLVGLSSHSTQAAVSPVLINNAPSYDLSGHLEQLVDPDGRLLLADVLSPALSSRFKPLQGYLNRGYSRDVVWLRFRLIRRKGFPLHAFLRLLPPNVDNVKVYAQSGESLLVPGSWQEISLGDHIPLVDRPVRNFNLVAPLTLPLERAVNVYIRIQTSSAIALAGTIHTLSDLVHITDDGIIFQSAYLGIALIIAILNLLSFIRLGDRIYLYFALFVFTLFANYLAQGGLLTLFFPYSERLFSNYFTGISFGATLLFLSLFSIHIFKSSFPKVCRFLNFLPVLGFLAILSISFGAYDMMLLFTVPGFLILIVVISLLSFRLVIKGEPDGLFYVAAFGISNLGSLLDLLMQLGWMHLEWWNAGTVQPLSLLNMVLMFLIMTKRLRMAEKQIASAALDSEKRALALASEMTTELQERTTELEVVLSSERLAAEALRQSEEQFRRLFEDHSAVMLVLDPVTGVIMDANQAAANFYGWTVEELCRMHIHEINTLPFEMVAVEIEKSRSLKQNEFQFRHRRADGSLRDVAVFSNSIKVAAKELIYSIIHDVTDRKCYEQVNACRLRMLQMASSSSSDELLRSALEEAEQLTESSMGFFFSVDEDQTTLVLQLCSTPGMEKKCSAEKKGEHSLFGKDGAWHDIIEGHRAVIHNNGATFRHCTGMPEAHAEVRCELLVPIIRNKSVVAIMGVGNKSCKYNDKDIEWVESLANQIWDIIAKKSADERSKKLQDQLQQSSKMEMIGHLAAGIVHEIKNPLNFLTLNNSSLQEDFEDLVECVGFYRRIIEKVGAFTTVAEEIELLRKKEQTIGIDDLLHNIPETLESSLNGIERIKTISQGLQSYSFKNVTGQFSHYDLNKAIQEALVIGKSEYRAVAAIELKLENLPMVLCDPAQINQVFLNLIINSTHAIQSQSRNSHGKIEIKTWVECESVFCSVADDGPGIPEGVVSRVFEPFFTTKEIGKGTGLGLSISYDIVVKKHHGTFAVDSPAGGGAIFTFSLPLEK